MIYKLYARTCKGLNKIYFYYFSISNLKSQKNLQIASDNP